MPALGACHTVTKVAILCDLKRRVNEGLLFAYLGFT